MQMFTKVQTRAAARSASFGSKVVDNGTASPKRWGRLVEVTIKQKESLTLISAKYLEKSVLILKVKKNKLSA